MGNKTTKFSLIVAIVSKGNAETVMDAAKKAGAEGGTIINGRGTGIHENLKLFGISIEPEKEIIFILIDTLRSEKVLHSVSKAAELHLPGKGIAFVLEVEQVVGICHLQNSSSADPAL